jgi:hypothetical protein
MFLAGLKDVSGSQQPSDFFVTAALVPANPASDSGWVDILELAAVWSNWSKRIFPNDLRSSPPSSGKGEGDGRHFGSGVFWMKSEEQRLEGWPAEPCDLQFSDRTFGRSSPVRYNIRSKVLVRRVRLGGGFFQAQTGVLERILLFYCRSRILRAYFSVS